MAKTSNDTLDPGDYPSALQAADRAIELSNEFPMAWAARGWSLGGIGRYQESVEAFDRALKLDPETEGLAESQKFVSKAEKSGAYEQQYCSSLLFSALAVPLLISIYSIR